MRIAVFGKMRSGKTEVCNIIKNNLECCHLEFGDSVQEVLDVLYPNFKGIKQRSLLVGVGQHLRKYDENIWVNNIKHKILKSREKHILVAGVRQKNEFEMLRELGFIFIKVESTDENRIARIKAQKDEGSLKLLNNSTELNIDNESFDYMIANGEDLAVLEQKTREIIIDIFTNEFSDSFKKKLIRRR